MFFTLDTCMLIDLADFYPRDVFKTTWEALEEEIAEGRICICQAVREELQRGGDDLYKWAKAITGFVCAESADDMKHAQTISQAYPEWVNQTKNAADPFLIAHGLTTARVVVTSEKWAESNVSNKKQKVPNVAKAFGVKTITLVEFFREQGWVF